VSPVRGSCAVWSQIKFHCSAPSGLAVTELEEAPLGVSA
jgi:hypothetical protein